MNAVINMFIRLASAQVSPDEWLCWWEKNESALSSELPRTFYLKLKPKLSHGKSGATYISQKAACDYLAKNGIEFKFIDKYSKEWIDDINVDVICFEKQAEFKKTTINSSIKKSFPSFYKAIQNVDSLDFKIEEGITGQVLEMTFTNLDCKLPAELKEFFQIVSTYSDDGINISFSELRNYDENYVVIGEYWREEDGSGLLIHKQLGTISVLSPSSGQILFVANSFIDFIENVLPEYLQ